MWMKKGILTIADDIFRSGHVPDEREAEVLAGCLTDLFNEGMRCDSFDEVMIDGAFFHAVDDLNGYFKPDGIDTDGLPKMIHLLYAKDDVMANMIRHLELRDYIDRDLLGKLLFGLSMAFQARALPHIYVSADIPERKSEFFMHSAMMMSVDAPHVLVRVACLMPDTLGVYARNEIRRSLALLSAEEKNNLTGLVMDSIRETYDAALVEYNGLNDLIDYCIFKHKTASIRKKLAGIEALSEAVSYMCPGVSPIKRLSLLAGCRVDFTEYTRMEEAGRTETAPTLAISLLARAGEAANSLPADREAAEQMLDVLRNIDNITGDREWKVSPKDAPGISWAIDGLDSFVDGISSYELNGQYAHIRSMAAGAFTGPVTVAEAEGTGERYIPARLTPDRGKVTINPGTFRESVMNFSNRSEWIKKQFSIMVPWSMHRKVGMKLMSVMALVMRELGEMMEHYMSNKLSKWFLIRDKVSAERHEIDKRLTFLDWIINIVYHRIRTVAGSDIACLRTSVRHLDKELSAKEKIEWFNDILGTIECLIDRLEFMFKEDRELSHGSYYEFLSIRGRAWSLLSEIKTYAARMDIVNKELGTLRRAHEAVIRLSLKIKNPDFFEWFREGVGRFGEECVLGRFFTPDLNNISMMSNEEKKFMNAHAFAAELFGKLSGKMDKAMEKMRYVRGRTLGYLSEKEQMASVVKDICGIILRDLFSFDIRQGGALWKRYEQVPPNYRKSAEKIASNFGRKIDLCCGMALFQMDIKYLSQTISGFSHALPSQETEGFTCEIRDLHSALADTFISVERLSPADETYGSEEKEVKSLIKALRGSFVTLREKVNRHVLKTMSVLVKKFAVIALCRVSGFFDGFSAMDVIEKFNCIAGDIQNVLRRHDGFSGDSREYVYTISEKIFDLGDIISGARKSDDLPADVSERLDLLENMFCVYKTKESDTDGSMIFTFPEWGGFIDDSSYRNCSPEYGGVSVSFSAEDGSAKFKAADGWKGEKADTLREVLECSFNGFMRKLNRSDRMCRQPPDERSAEAWRVQMDLLLEGLPKDKDICVIVNERVPVNAMLLRDGIVVLNRDFVEMILRYLGTMHREAALFVLAERLMHELGHLSLAKSKKDMIQEESSQIERDVLFHERIFRGNRCFSRMVDDFTGIEVASGGRRDRFSRVFYSSRLFRNIRQWALDIPDDRNRVKRDIRLFVVSELKNIYLGGERSLTFPAVPE